MNNALLKILKDNAEQIEDLAGWMETKPSELLQMMINSQVHILNQIRDALDGEQPSPYFVKNLYGEFITELNLECESGSYEISI